MRFVFALIVLIMLSACASDADDTLVGNDTDVPIDEVVGSNEPMNGTQNATIDDEPTAPVPDVPIPDPANESANLSDEWIIGEDESGNPLIVEPRARLNESFLGIVPSSDPTPRIMSFSLISASTNRVISGYENMTGLVRIDREKISQRLAVRANYAGKVGSVLFALGDDENHRVENAPPFALHGVDEFGSYTPWVPDRGRYVIRATPYVGRDAIGEHRDPVTLTLEFYAPGYLERVPLLSHDP